MKFSLEYINLCEYLLYWNDRIGRYWHKILFSFLPN